MRSDPAQLPLSIRDLTFRYRIRTEPALRNVSFDLQPGELLLLAGSSGCGKTTLMRCINGLIPRTYKGELSGQILYDGQEMTKAPLSRISQMVGTVLQDPERQILGTKVVNEVAFGLENLTLPREEIMERVYEVMGFLGIRAFAERDTHNLSGGEKQKVALAGVLAMRPRILLLDEPLASLDPASGREAMGFIRRLANEGISILCVEHRVEDVLGIQPDRVMYMEQGEIRYLGDAPGLMHHVDYHEIKLPAALILERAAAMPPGTAPLAPLPPVNPPGTAPLIQFQNVRFGYDSEREVIHGVNLSIYPGEVVAILGANGAGKTTLVKHAIGLLKPKAGSVLVNGRNTRHTSTAQIAASLGYVFQSPSHMLFAPTVREELSFGPQNLKHSPEQVKKEVEQAIAIVNLTGRETDPPLAMSFGQQKRVSIAAVLAMQSRILVMDEPTAGQDYFNYNEFMQAILEMRNFDAILFITHDIDLAVTYANRVLIVRDGSIVVDAAPAQALSDFDRLEQCRLVPTSLLRLNMQKYSQTQRFMSAEALAHFHAP